MNYVQFAQPAEIPKQALQSYLRGLRVDVGADRNSGNWIISHRSQNNKVATHRSASGHFELLKFTGGGRLGASAISFRHHSSAEEEGAQASYLVALESLKAAWFRKSALSAFKWFNSPYHQALSSLATTEENWDDNGSAGPSAEAMNTTEQVAKRFHERGVLDLTFYPAPGSGVDVQWRTATSLLIIEIISDGKIGAVRRVSGFSVETCERPAPDEVADWATDRDQQEG